MTLNWKRTAVQFVMSRKDSKLATKLQGEGNQFKSTQRDAVLDFTLNLKDFLIKFEF